jgi:hypothetical protein
LSGSKPSAIEPKDTAEDKEPDFSDFSIDQAPLSPESSAPVTPESVSKPALKNTGAAAESSPFNFDELLGNAAVEDESASNNENAFDLGSLSSLENDFPASPNEIGKESQPTTSDDLGFNGDNDADLLPPLKMPHGNAKEQIPASDPFSLDEDTPLPPVKPAAAIKPTLKPAIKPAPIEDFNDDTPLPPMKPAETLIPDLADEDTPLPPMKPKTPAAKENKDPFAALFSETEMNLNLSSESGAGSKDPFSSLDLDLDVLEVFPADDQQPLPPASGKKPPAAPAKTPAAEDNNPFNLDNIIDLDTPVENKAKSKPKAAKDPSILTTLISANLNFEDWFER